MGFHYSGFPLVASILLLGYSILDYRRAKRYRVDLVGLALVIFSWAMFVSSFLMDDFNLLSVYGYSTREMPVWLKIASSWAGMGGSFVLWAVMMAVVTALYRVYSDKRGTLEPAVMRGYMFTTLVIAFLAIEAGAFTTADVNYTIPAGAGLNPLLRSFWILVHPIFTFAGYALSIALALYVVLSKLGSSLFERLIAGLGWLNLSIGIIAGAVWAYVVLGWGGYWAWDPVETAELVPWLALTAYFHSFRSVGEGGRRLTAALAGFYTFYSSFMTKAGAQFTASVHTFEWSPSATTLIALHFLAGGIILALYLRSPGRFSWNIGKNLTSISFHLAWWSLIILSLISFLGIFTPVVYTLVTGSLISVGVEYYNTYSLPFAYLFILGLIGCSLRDRIGLKTYALAAMIATVMGVAGAATNIPTSNWMANFLIPALAIALGAASYRIIIDLAAKRARPLSISLLHLAIPVILLGVALNSTLETSTVLKLNVSEPASTPYGVTIVYEGYSIRVSDWNIFYSGHLIPEGAYGDFKFRVIDGGTAYDITLPVWVPFAYGCGSEPGMISKGLDDIYVSILHADFHNRLRDIIMNNAFYGGESSIDYILVEVRYNPFIALVWLGCALLILAEALTITTLFRPGGGHG